MWDSLGAAVVTAAADGAGGVVLVVGVCAGGEKILKKKSHFELYSFVDNSYLHFVLNSLLGPPVSALKKNWWCILGLKTVYLLPWVTVLVPCDSSAEPGSPASCQAAGDRDEPTAAFLPHPIYPPR